MGLVPLSVVETSARAAGEQNGALRKLLPQQARHHGGVLSRRVCYQFQLSEWVQVQGISHFYAAIVGDLRSFRFDGYINQRRGCIEQKGGWRASWCKDEKVQVLLPHKRDARNVLTLFVMALVVG